MSKKNPSGLTDKQEAFCREYVIDPDHNITQSYRKAYPKCNGDKAASTAGSRLLENVGITTFIGTLQKPSLDKYDISIERVNREKAKIAFFDPEKLYYESGLPIPIHKLDPMTRGAIAGVKIKQTIGSDGEMVLETDLKISNKNQILDQLSKQHGMYEKDNAQKPVLAMGIAAENLLLAIKNEG